MPIADNPPYACRVTFEYDGDQVRKVAQQRIEMTTPPTHDLGGEDGVGFWYELRDGADRPVYRRVVQSPIETTVEVFSPEGRISRQPVAHPSGVFQIIVPEIALAPTLVLVATPQPGAVPIGTVAEERQRPAQARVGTTPAREIARFDLREGAE